MQVIIHRYLLEGKNEQTENTLSQLKGALAAGSCFETDIRRLKSGEFYISHNPQDALTTENDAREHARLWRERGCRIALNIKELGYERELVEFLKTQHVIGSVFLFDFDIEFLGADPNAYIKNIRSFEPALACAVRVSDHNEPVSRALDVSGSNIIWLDEFDSMWVTEQDMRELKAAGKTVYCVSPDLHGFSLEQTKARWKDFMAWQADGICTDYPLLLKQTLAQ